MATRTISTKLKLEGENEYKAGLTNVNRELAALNAKLKAVESEYAGNANSLEALRSKQSVYAELLTTQKQKLELYKTQLEKAKQAQSDCTNNTQQLTEGIAAQNANIAEMIAALKTSTDGTVKLYDEQGNLVREYQDGQKAIDEFKAELKEMNAALKQSEEDGQRAENTIREYEKNVYNAQAACNNLNDEVKQNQKYLDEATKSTKHCATSIDEMGKKTEKSSGFLSRFGQRAVELFSIVSLVGVVKKVADSIVHLGKKAIDTADNINTLSTITGQSSTRLQELQYAGGLLDVELSTITDSLKRLINNMDAARNGTGDALKAFEMLGINIYDANGELRDSNQVFYEAIDALGKLTNETERDAAAQNIFGKSATDLNPLIKAGADELARLSKEAHTAGAVMSEEAVDALDAFGDKVDAVKTSVTAFVGESLAHLIGDGRSSAEVMRDLMGSLDDKGRTQTLIDRYRQLSGEINNSALSSEELEQKTAEWEQARQDIISSSGGIVSAINIENGTFAVQVDKLSELNERERQLQILRLESVAAENVGKAALKDFAKATTEYEDTQVKATAAYDEWLRRQEQQERGQAGTRYVQEAKTAYDELQSSLTDCGDRLAELSDANYVGIEAVNALVEAGVSADEICVRLGTDMAGLNAILETTSDATESTIPEIVAMDEALGALNAEYEAAKEVVRSTLDSVIAGWEKVAPAVAVSADEVIANLQSQMDWMANYRTNLDALMGRKIPRVDTSELVASLSDGSAESAAILAGLASATDAQVAEIVRGMSGISEGKEAFIDEVGAAAVNLDERFKEIADNTAKAVADMNMFGEAKVSGAETIQGYINGVNGKSGALNIAMSRAAQAAMNAWKRTLDQRSPSREFKKSGEYSIEGYIQGVQGKENGLKDVMSEAAELAAKSFGDSFKDAQETAKNLIAGYSDMISAMLDDVDDRIDETEKKRDAQVKKLSDYGDYLQKVTQSWSSGAKVEYNQLTDLSGQIETLREYDRVLTELGEKTLPKELLDEIVDMNVDDLIEYGGMLLNLTDKDFDAYIAKWSEKQELAKDIADKFYSDELISLETEYKDKLQAGLDGMKAVSLESGKSVVQGLIDGMRAKEAELKTQAQKLAAIVTETTKATLQIRSPSKVMEQLGKFTVQGFDAGLQEEFTALQKKMPTANSVDVKQAKQADFGGMLSQAVNAINLQSGNSHFTVEVPVNLNGREVARVIAPDLRAYNSYDPEVVSDNI